MVRPATLEDSTTVNAHGTATLLVKQPGSEVALALERGLRAAGLPLLVVTNPYDAVAEAARTDPPVRYLLVGVDFFDGEAFRLLPLFRREWPETTIAAYHSPGFEHKGRIAGLVGADVVLSRPDQLLTWLAKLARQERRNADRPEPERAETEPAPPARPQPARVRATRPATARPAEAPPAPEPVEAPPAAAPAPPAGETPPPREPPPKEPPPPPKAAPVPEEAVPETTPTEPPAGADETADEPGAPSAAASAGQQDSEDEDEEGALAGGRIIGTVELTDEELRILLGEDDDT
jgi:hypothetical protein